MTRKDNTADHVQNTTSQKLQMDTDQRTIKSKTDLKESCTMDKDNKRLSFYTYYYLYLIVD